MPRRGGEADKLGNRYEGLWAVDAALDLIDGEYVDLTVEAIGDEAAGVEFVRTGRSDVLEYHSIKRQQGNGNWALSSLVKAGPTGRSILGDLVAKVDSGSDGVFSSGTSASELTELIEHARATDSFEEFDARIRQNAKRSGQFLQVRGPNLWQRGRSLVRTSAAARANSRRGNADDSRGEACPCPAAGCGWAARRSKGR